MHAHTLTLAGPDPSFEQSVQLLLGQVVCEELWGVPTHNPGKLLEQQQQQQGFNWMNEGVQAAEDAQAPKLSAQVSSDCSAHYDQPFIYAVPRVLFIHFLFLGVRTHTHKSTEKHTLLPPLYLFRHWEKEPC